MRKLFPLLLGLVGLAAGVGGGLVLRPDPAAEVASEVECAALDDDVLTAAPGKSADADDHAAPQDAEAHAGEAPTTEFVKLNNQFIVPVIEERAVGALVILTLSLEVTTGSAERVYGIEPKLRDSFLQVLFDHANSGGFDGNFTESGNLEILRNGLVEVARKILGAAAENVMIESIMRQDA